MTNLIETGEKPSQIEADDNIREKAAGMTVSQPDDLKVIRNLTLSLLEVRPYDESTESHERAIRWKRTAAQIVRDGFVYEGKACSDINIVFLTFCRQVGLETKLVKLRAVNGKGTHTISEVKIGQNWFRYDVISDSAYPEAGQVVEGVEYGSPPWGPYILWKKADDLWGMGLVDFDSENIIYQE